jgi:hypothetical protein
LDVVLLEVAALLVVDGLELLVAGFTWMVRGVDASHYIIFAFEQLPYLGQRYRPVALK